MPFFFDKTLNTHSYTHTPKPGASNRSVVAASRRSAVLSRQELQRLILDMVG